MAILGLLLAVVFLIYVSMKGLDLITTTILASIIIIVTGGLEWWPALSDGYATSFIGFAKNGIFLIVLGSLFGQLMNDSGSAQVVAEKITKTIGVKRTLLAIGITSFVFTMLGVNGFVIMFVMVPIATTMMKDSKMPRYLLPAAVGFGTVPACGLVPYSVDITNVIPTQYLGTDISAAPVLGIIGGLLVFIIGYIWLARETKKAQATLSDEELLAGYEKIDIDANIKKDVPSIGVAVLPLLVVMVLILTTSKVLKMEGTPSVIVSLGSACALTILLNLKRFEQVTKSIKTAVDGGFVSLATACAVLGFSGVVKLSPGFPSIIEGILNINLHPYFVEWIGVNALSAVAGSSIAGITIFMENLAQPFLDMGMNPEVLHRLAPLAGAGLNDLPNSIVVALVLAYTRVSFKDGYKHMFMTATLGPVIASLIVTILAVLGLAA